jgi:hypothetical protein
MGLLLCNFLMLFPTNCHLLFIPPISSFCSHLSQLQAMFNQIFFVPLDLLVLTFVVSSIFVSGSCHLFNVWGHSFFTACLIPFVARPASTVSSVASVFNTPSPQPLNTCLCCTGTWPYSYFGGGIAASTSFPFLTSFCDVSNIQPPPLLVGPVTYWLSHIFGLSSFFSPHTVLFIPLCIVSFYH